MIVWRLCRRAHADLSGTGGTLTAGRWHEKGAPILYTAMEPALAVLEVRVNLDLPFELLPEDYVMLAIEVPQTAPCETLDTLPADPRAFGTAWLAAKRSACLIVPSVVVPQARNLLINPLHEAARHISIAALTSFGFDARLWR